MSFEFRTIQEDPILFPGEDVAPQKPGGEVIPQISEVPLEQLAKYGLIGIDLTIQKANPSIIFDASTAGDTDYWFGLRNDGDGNDDDFLEMGRGLVTGTSEFLRIDNSNSTGPIISLIRNGGALATPTIFLQTDDPRTNYTSISAVQDGTTYIKVDWTVRSATYASIWHLIGYRGNTGAASTRDVMSLAGDGNMKIVTGGLVGLTSDQAGTLEISGGGLNIWHQRTVSWVYNSGSPSGAGTKYNALRFSTDVGLQVGPTHASSTLALFAGSTTAVATLADTSITLADATNIAVNTTTGTKIGTATSQKLGFFNATPIIQPVATTDLGTVLSNLGLRAVGTAYPITTSGAVNFTGGVTIATVGLTITDVDIALSTSTGTKIGTATNQKLGFWNVTPVIQQVLSAYTSDSEGVAYTGIDNAQAGTVYATVADLNQLRVAYETLRAAHDDLRTKLITTGIVA